MTREQRFADAINKNWQSYTFLSGYVDSITCKFCGDFARSYQSGSRYGEFKPVIHRPECVVLEARKVLD